MLPLLALVLSPGLAGCLESTPNADILGTFYPMTFLAASIAGDQMTSANLVAEGVEPHDWDPSVRDITRMAGARLIVAQDPSFEPWLAKSLASLGKDAPDVVYTAEQILSDSARQQNGTRAAAQEPLDPHTWLDPVLFSEQAFHVRAALRKADPANAANYDAATIVLVQRIGQLGADFGNALDTCTTRHIVVQHDAFGHLARRYNITTHAVSGLSPEAEPDPATVDRIIQAMREHNITAVFVEPLFDPGVMEAIARETGARVLTLNPLESRTPAQRSAGHDYVDIMRANLAALVDGMECNA